MFIATMCISTSVEYSELPFHTSYRGCNYVLLNVNVIVQHGYDQFLYAFLSM
jgi:hypothetical protein